MDYWTRPASTAEEVDAVARQVADGSADLVRLSGIDWRVLEVTSDNRALLLADRVIGTGPYNETLVETTWEQCDLRRWLNGAFLGSLGGALSARVLSATVRNGPNPTWGMDGGRDTEDQVFLISMQEAASYLSGREPNWEEYRSGDFQSDNLKAKTEGSSGASWWLRSPGNRTDCAAHVGVGGLILSSGVVVYMPCGVRPAFWLNLES
ncbi:MAG: DUF6273 domain-containing protein [Micrococcales bacterium]|nr:DUF6273 domain-containing protein [Micrococcales bacterium]